MTQQVEYVYEVYTWPTKKIISVRYWDLGVIDAQNSDSWSLRIKVMVGDNLRVCPHMWLFSMLDDRSVLPYVTKSEPEIGDTKQATGSRPAYMTPFYHSLLPGVASMNDQHGNHP